MELMDVSDYLLNNPNELARLMEHTGGSYIYFKHPVFGRHVCLLVIHLGVENDG